MKLSSQKRSSICIGGTIFIFIVHILKLYFTVTNDSFNLALLKLLDSDDILDLCLNLAETFMPSMFEFIKNNYSEMALSNTALGLVLFIKLCAISKNFDFDTHKVEYTLWSMLAIFFACEKLSDIWLSSIICLIFGICSLIIECIDKIWKKHQEKQAKNTKTKVKVKKKKKRKVRVYAKRKVTKKVKIIVKNNEKMKNAFRRKSVLQSTKVIVIRI